MDEFTFFHHKSCCLPSDNFRLFGSWVDFGPRIEPESSQHRPRIEPESIQNQYGIDPESTKDLDPESYQSRPRIGTRSHPVRSASADTPRHAEPRHATWQCLINWSMLSNIFNQHLSQLLIISALGPNSSPQKIIILQIRTENSG